MGRKLTDWEKIQRKEEFNESYEESSRLVEEWKEFYHSVTNLQVAASHYIGEHDTIFDWISSEVVPKRVPPFTRKVKVKPDREFTVGTFIPHPALKHVKQEVTYTLKDFCRVFKKTYIPLLDLLVGTKREYKSFIQSRKDIIAVEEKRKEEYLKMLNKYEEKERQYFNRLEEKQMEIKSRYDSFAKDLKTRMEETERIVTQIKNEFDDTTKSVFYQVLLSNLPLKFPVPEHKFLKWDPTDWLNWKVGLGLAKPDTDFLNVYVLMPEDHFPLEDKQLVLLKETHSVHPLTKQQHQEVETNFYASMAMSYAHYFFRFTKRNNVYVHLLIDGVDPATGKETKRLYKGYQFDRETFELMNLEALVPSAAIKKFSVIQSLPKDNIMWTWILVDHDDPYPIAPSKELDKFLCAKPVKIPSEYFNLRQHEYYQAERDEPFNEALLNEALQLIVEHQEASESLLVEKLKLSYDRASRLIDQLEEAGVIGPFEGNETREILFRNIDNLNTGIILKDWDILFERAALLVVNRQHVSVSQVANELEIDEDRVMKILLQLKTAGVINIIVTKDDRYSADSNVLFEVIVKNHDSLPKLLDDNSGGLFSLRKELQNCSLPKKIKSIDGSESEWLQALRKRNPKVADELAAWDDATTRSLMQQKKSLIKLGIDTTDVDAFAKKYGHNIG